MPFMSWSVSHRGSTDIFIQELLFSVVSVVSVPSVIKAFL